MEPAPRGPWRRREPSAGRQQPRSARLPGGPHVLKLLARQALAAAVIGRGGAQIQELQRSSQAVVDVSRVNELFHHSGCRILSASAESEDRLNKVVRQVLEVLKEVSERDAEGSDDCTLRMSMLVPRVVITNLLADGGQHMRDLVATSGATCQIADSVEDGGPDATQEVRLRGSLQALEFAICKFNHQVQLQVDEPWFAAWASPSRCLVRAQEEPGGGREPEPLPFEQESASSTQPGFDRDYADSPAVLKVLAPRTLAKACAPAALSELGQRAQAQLVLSGASETFSHVPVRVLTARAQTLEHLDLVGEWVVARLAEAAEADPSDETASWEGDLKLSCIIPKAAGAVLIGRGGSVIRHLTETSGAHVQVVRDGAMFGKAAPESNQKVEIRGTPDSLEQVLREIASVTFTLHDEVWFNGWVNGTTAARSPLEHLRGSCQAAEVGMDLVGRVMEGLPPYVLEESRGFAMTCVVPGRLVGAVIGRNGSGVDKVMSVTKTRIAMKQMPGDVGDWSMNIAGPLLNTCSAYMLMMQRYLDAEKEVLGGRG